VRGWDGGAAFSAVVGSGGRGATVVLLDGRSEVIIGDGGLKYSERPLGSS